MSSPKVLTGFSVAKAAAQHSQVHENVAQEYIITTADKATLCLIKHKKALESGQRWIAPAGILLAVLPSLLGSDFKDFMDIKKEVWEALYLLVALVSGGWLLLAIIDALKTRKERAVNTVVENLKKAGQ